MAQLEKSWEVKSASSTSNGVSTPTPALSSIGVNRRRGRGHPIQCNSSRCRSEGRRGELNDAARLAFESMQERRCAYEGFHVPSSMRRALLG